MVTVSGADLTSRYQAGEQRSSQLQSRIRAETDRIQGFEGTIGALQGRLTAVEHSVAIQEGLLSAVSNQLDAARLRLSRLRVEYAHDLSTLAAQLRADYETPPPTLVGVVVNSGGFSALLTGLSDLTTIERRNTQIAVAVRAARAAVETQARRLAQVLVRRRRATAAVIVERDTIAQLKVSIVDRELTVVHARTRDARRLRAVHATLVHEAQILDRAPPRPRPCPRAAPWRPRADAPIRRSSPTAASTASSPPPAPTTRSTRSRSSPRGSTSSARPCNCT